MIRLGAKTAPKLEDVLIKLDIINEVVARTGINKN